MGQPEGIDRLQIGDRVASDLGEVDPLTLRRRRSCQFTKHLNGQFVGCLKLLVDQKLLEREIKFHDELVELARDPKVLKVLTDLTNDLAFRQWAARDPVGVAKMLGIKVPLGVKLRIEGNALANVRVQVLSHEGLYPFLVTWDGERGFSPVREPMLAKKE